MAVLHEVEISHATVEPQTYSINANSLRDAESKFQFEFADMQVLCSIGTGLKNKIGRERFREGIDRDIWQSVSNSPPASNFNRECLGAAMVHKGQRAKGAILDSRIVSILRRPIAEALWHDANDGQLNGDDGSGTEIGGVSSYARRVVASYQEPKLNYAGANQPGSQYREPPRIISDSFIGSRLGALAFGALAMLTCCACMIRWLR